MKENQNRILALDVTDSTNTVLKRMAIDGAEAGQVVTAAEQTAGKGRLGRSFHSPKGQGIYLSYLLRPTTPPEMTAHITAWAAVAARDAVKNATGADTEIKWVNDLILNGKKVCGILTERVSVGEENFVIIGVGINANGTAENLPADIRDKAGYISELTGEEVSSAKLEGELIKALDRLKEDWPVKQAEYLEKYRKWNAVTGKEVLVTGTAEKKGKAIAVNDDFSLKIQYEDGCEEDVFTGEVSVRGLYGYMPE